MLLRYDVATRELKLADPTLPAALTVSRAEPLSVLLTDNLVDISLPDGASLKLVLKQKGKFDSDPLASLTLDDGDVNGNAENRYDGVVDLINAAVQDALLVNDDDSDDLASIACLLEVQYSAADGADFIPSITKLAVTIYNAVGQEDDAAPLGAAYAGLQVLHSITGLTGGGATKLDGIATVSIPVPRIVVVYVSSELQFWRLAAGTTAEDGTGIVRPDDYNAGTNEKIWTRIA